MARYSLAVSRLNAPGAAENAGNSATGPPPVLPFEAPGASRERQRTPNPASIPTTPCRLP